MRWVVTGGAGFIGSNLVRMALANGWASEVVVLDALTYAGNLENLAPVADHPGFTFVHGDINKPADVRRALGSGADAVFHLAAESHVDRSIHGASDFVRTNVGGTQVLLDACLACDVGRFVHVSTDEVYGSLQLDDAAKFTEATNLSPNSPYAASKASSDLLVLACARTHGFNAVVTRCSNNYGPYQFPEKFIPLFITNAMTGEALPMYGDGLNVRDWVHVDNHVLGLKLACERGTRGEVYNLGGDCERSNMEIAEQIMTLTGASRNLLKRVADRLGHDRRYAIDGRRSKDELGFDAGLPIEERLAELVQWYDSNRPWWQAIKEGQYRSYYEDMYAARMAATGEHNEAEAPVA